MSEPPQVLLGESRVFGFHQPIPLAEPEPAAFEAVEEGHHQGLVRQETPHIRLIAPVDRLEDGQCLPVALHRLEVHPMGLHVGIAAIAQLILDVEARGGDQERRGGQSCQDQ